MSAAVAPAQAPEAPPAPRTVRLQLQAGRCVPVERLRAALQQQQVRVAAHGPRLSVRQVAPGHVVIGLTGVPLRTAETQ
ncbi:MAG: hypothetical protein ACPGUV_12445, partial [Polyangiales bacterium]